MQEVAAIRAVPGHANCVAVKRNGEGCKNAGTKFEGLCGTHHNAKLKTDTAYRDRYQTHVNQIRQVEDAERREMEQRAQAREAARQRRLAREQAQRAQIAEQQRQQTIQENHRKVQNAHLASPAMIMSVTRRVGRIWHLNNIRGYDLVKAYTFLRYVTSTHAGFANLMRACVVMTNINPETRTYLETPVEERNAQIAAIVEVLAPYADLDYNAYLPEDDDLMVHVRERRALDEANRIRREQFERDLRERPVIFARDPEGSVNLAAFATDNQNIHRSSVQNSTHNMVLVLMNRAVEEGQDTLVEITAQFENPAVVRWWTWAVDKDKALQELYKDYFDTEAFSVKYGDVLDRVWTFIRNHENKNDLSARLAEECFEGIGMCSNGKMARLVNVLQGYDPVLVAEAPRELFQAKIALLTKEPLESRESAARALFAEFKIPEDEQTVWLEPLLEA